MTGALLEVVNVTKTYGPSRALRGVSFSLTSGEVHALIGENGAGKSTLMKVLSGAVRPDGGSMTLGGLRYAPRSPKDARARGVAMIYQELALAPHLSVESNVMLGQERSRAGLIDRGEHRRLVRDALRVLDHPEIDLDRPVGTLSVGSRQVVEIARALVSQARVIILDEPTSSLAQRDVSRLFEVIGRLRGAGIAIVYISHFLEEVQAIAQRYTVLRDGEAVASGYMEKVGLKTLIREMVGRDLGEIFPKIPHEPGEVVLELSSVASRRRIPLRAELRVRRGEILGIAGLVGSGRTELLRSIFGLEQVESGRLVVKGLTSHSASPRARIRQGLGFLSENRKDEGLALGRSIEDNVTYPALTRHSFLGFLNLRGRRREVAELVRRVNVKSEGPWQRVADLSGGNQQKVALARLLHQRADVILLDEPTRGIDVGSKAEIYRMIGELASRGAAVMIVSSYMPELFGVCDRLAVMRRGVLSEARPISEWDQHSVMEASTAS